MKTTIAALCMLLLGSCPFLPPSPYQHIGFGVYPESSISLPVGISIEDEAELSLPGPIDVISVSSELNDQTLSATLFLRELPENLQWGPDVGHMQDFQVQWIVMVDVEGDPSTPFEWHDYILKATFYKPEMARTTPDKVLPAHPWVNAFVRKCGPETLEESGRVYNSCPATEEYVKLDISYLDNSITLTANIPGLNKNSTIAFWVWGMLAMDQEWIPHSQQ